MRSVPPRRVEAPLKRCVRVFRVIRVISWIVLQHLRERSTNQHETHEVDPRIQADIKVVT